MKKLFLFIAVLAAASVQAQKPDAKAPENWFNLSYKETGVRGVGTERTYNELAKNRKADTVIVAVLDGGVDYKHEDLAPVMWVNRKEIAGNKIDDDKNGYVDDIHGWNFLGNADGRNVQFDQL
ncbi:MAG: peptidase S8, partial [Bacteroidia bacterium]